MTPVRWVLAAVVAAGLVMAAYGATVLATHGGFPFRKLRVASESMAPTLRPPQTITAHKTAATDLRRGDIAVFNVREHDWVMRVVGLPADRIAMRGGVVILNGVPIQQTEAGTLTIEGQAGRIRTEALPGEAGSHRILDLGSSPGDDMAEIAVPAGHLFLLGDNRDNAADSRFPADPLGGIGPVAFEAVFGVVRPEELNRE